MYEGGLTAGALLQTLLLLGPGSRICGKELKIPRSVEKGSKEQSLGSGERRWGNQRGSLLRSRGSKALPSHCIR